MTTEYEEFKKKVEKQRKVVARKQLLVNKQIAILNELLKECQHEEIEPKEDYVPGTYLDTAYSEYWNQCSLCGARSEKIRKSHGWYG